MDLSTPQQALRAAATLCGSQAALGQAVDRAQSTVSEWILRGRCPAEIAVRISRATDGRIPASALRPDLYGPASRRDSAVDAS